MSLEKMAQKEIESQKMQSISQRKVENDQNQLNNYLQLAELCSDPEEIFKYMEERDMCLGLSMFWKGKARLYGLMGDYKKAVEELRKGKSMAEDVCQCKQDADMLVSEIDQQLKEIEEKLENTLKRVSNKQTSIEMYELLHQNTENPEKNRNDNRLEQLAELFQKNQELLKEQKAKYENSIKGKPKSCLNNDFNLNSGPKIRRTRSILHKPACLTNIPLDDRPKNVGSPKSGIKFQRSQTQDSIEILKNKKKQPKSKIQDTQQEIEEQSKLYRTTSLLDKKKVHFSSSQFKAKVKQEDNPKFRSAIYSRRQEKKIDEEKEKRSQQQP